MFVKVKIKGIDYTAGSPSKGQIKKCIKANSKLSFYEREEECQECSFNVKCNLVKEKGV